MFGLSGYRHEAHQRDPLLDREAALAIAVTFVGLLIPLILTSLSVKEYGDWISATTRATDNWVKGSNWTVQSVNRSGGTIVINLVGEGSTGSIAELQAQVRKSVPTEIPVQLVEVQGANRSL